MHLKPWLEKRLPVALGVMMLWFCIAAAQAATPVGKVLTATGSIVAMQVGGATRPLQRKSDFYAGELLKTGADSRAQIKMIDGALISLQPDTEFRVNVYRFDAATKKNNSSVIEITKGGLRTITGLIAKENHAGYKLNTPVATIGVRGTDLETAVLGNSLSVAFWSGGGTVANAAGSVDLGEGADYKFAWVADENSAPVPSLSPRPPPGESRAMEITDHPILDPVLDPLDDSPVPVGD